MSFSVAAIATSIAGVVLGLGWLFVGELVLKRWHVEADPTGLLVGRRLGAVYLGIAIMLFFARSAPVSAMRTAVSIGMIWPSRYWRRSACSNSGPGAPATAFS